MPYKILIVEDETILREIVKDYLVNEGHEVIEAILSFEFGCLFTRSFFSKLSTCKYVFAHLA